MYNLNEKNLMQIANEAMDICKDLNIEIADKISFVINKRALSFAGKCHRYKDGSFKIEICERFANSTSVKRKNVVEVMLHELIHTVQGCWDHGNIFKEYMYRINYATDYNVSVRDTADMTAEKRKTARFVFECKDCGTKYLYQRFCNTVHVIKNDPNAVACGKCNKKGSIVLIEQDGKTVKTVKI